MGLAAVLLMQGCEAVHQDGEHVPGPLLQAPADEMPLRRPALHAPAMVVEGRGKRADGLLDRIRADVAEGWHGTYVVPDGCNDDDCLHWWVASADGAQRIEYVPAVQVTVVILEKRELQIDPSIVLGYARQLADRHFPGADEIDVRYDNYEEYISNRDVTLTLHSVRDGTPMHVEIQAWMGAISRDASAPGADRSITDLHAYLRSAPLGALDADALSQWSVYPRVWLREEGWDAQLDECVAKAMMIATAAYVGSDSDSQAARSRCYDEWGARKSSRDLQQAVGAPADPP